MRQKTTPRCRCTRPDRCASPWHNDAVHLENLLEPWIALRLLLAVSTVAVLSLACWPAWTALRRFDVVRASEGQLLLERRFELAVTAGKLGAGLLVAGVFLTCLAAAETHTQLRGAMCAYGVFQISPLGFTALGIDLACALLGGVLWQVHAIEERLPRLDLVKPLALATFVLAAFALVSLVYNAQFWLGLDRSVVASCCSLELDAAVVQAGQASASAPLGSALGGACAVLIALAFAGFAARRPSRRSLTGAGLASVLAAPLAALAIAEWVAPHVFETPTHRCPFCLLEPSAGYLGYLLFAALLVACSRAVGMGLLARLLPTGDPLRQFGPRALRASALAWGVLLLASAAPVLRFWVLYDARSLFP